MKKRTHLALGMSARKLRLHLQDTEGLKPGEDLVFLAQALAFLIHDTPIDVSNSALTSPQEMFSLRKLKAAVELLEKFHELHPKSVVTSYSK